MQYAEARRLPRPATGATVAAALAFLVVGVVGAHVIGVTSTPATAAADGRGLRGYGQAQELYRQPPSSPPAAPPASAAPAPVPMHAAPFHAVPVLRSTGPSLPGPMSRTLELLDADRAAAGLAPLRLDAALTRAAAVHVAAQAAQDQMSHDGYVADVSAQGFAWRGLGEVLGMWRPTADAGAVNALWMQSAAHRPIILDGAYTAVGIAWAQSSAGDWFADAILAF